MATSTKEMEVWLEKQHKLRLHFKSSGFHSAQIRCSLVSSFISLVAQIYDTHVSGATGTWQQMQHNPLLHSPRMMNRNNRVAGSGFRARSRVHTRSRLGCVWRYQLFMSSAPCGRWYRNQGWARICSRESRASGLATSSCVSMSLEKNICYTEYYTWIEILPHLDASPTLRVGLDRPCGYVRCLYA